MELGSRVYSAEPTGAYEAKSEGWGDCINIYSGSITSSGYYLDESAFGLLAKKRR